MEQWRWLWNGGDGCGTVETGVGQWRQVWNGGDGCGTVEKVWDSGDGCGTVEMGVGWKKNSAHLLHLLTRGTLCEHHNYINFMNLITCIVVST